MRWLRDDELDRIVSHMLVLVMCSGALVCFAVKAITGMVR